MVCWSSNWIYRDVADKFGISISALYFVITRVTDFILLLAPNIIKYPSQREREEIANFYLQEKGFPGIIGKYKYVGVYTPPPHTHIYLNYFCDAGNKNNHFDVN